MILLPACGYGHMFRRKRLLLHCRAKLGGYSGYIKTYQHLRIRHGFVKMCPMKIAINCGISLERSPKKCPKVWNQSEKKKDMSCMVSRFLGFQLFSIWFGGWFLSIIRSARNRHLPATPRHMRCQVWAPAARCSARHDATAVPTLLRVSPRRG